jgi:pimeloyl-ACP methyl ester carboxylesterase
MSPHIHAAAQTRPVRTAGTVRSADGTQIGWEQVGAGVAIVIVHGGTRAAEHYRALADALASRFTVIAYDRRGRGASGPARVDDGFDVEVADLEAVLRATGATRVFGHSAGALISLEATRRLPVIQRLALYEPPVGQSIPTAWLPAFEQALAGNDVARAMALAIDGLKMGPRYLPVWALALPMRLAVRGEMGRKLGALLGTLPRDMATVRSVPPGFERYREIACPTLLLSGGKSPAYLHKALDELAAALPHVERTQLPTVGHNAPDQEAPEAVAAHLAKFFAA